MDGLLEAALKDGGSGLEFFDLFGDGTEVAGALLFEGDGLGGRFF